MKKWDMLILVLVAVLSLLPLAFLGGRGVARVTVAQYGRILYEGDLQTDARIETESGGNVIEIRNGEVRMVYADCPDGLCLSDAARPHLPLVCLPNGVTVTVTGSEEVLPLDGITY